MQTIWDLPVKFKEGFISRFMQIQGLQAWTGMNLEIRITSNCVPWTHHMLTLPYPGPVNQCFRRIQRSLDLGTKIDGYLPNREWLVPQRCSSKRTEPKENHWALIWGHIWGLSGLPCWLRWLRICLQCRRPGFNPWVGKIPWVRVWQPTPVFSPGESPWTEEPGRLEYMGSQRVGHDWVTKHSTAHEVYLWGSTTETTGDPLAIVGKYQRETWPSPPHVNGRLSKPLALGIHMAKSLSIYCLLDTQLSA